MPVKMTITADDKATNKLRKLRKETERTGKAAGQTSKKFDGLNRSMKSNLGTLVSFTAAFMALRGGIKALTSFETTMAEVSTIVDTTSVNMGELSDQILQLSTIIPQTADELGAGLYETISAGITDTAEAMEFLTTASKLAVAGMSDTATTVDALTTIMNSYGLATSEATRISDILFSTVEAGKIKISLLAGSIGNVASGAALAGVDITELAAAIAVMTKTTGQVDETMTSLNRLFLSIATATPTVRKAAEKLGIEWTASALRAKGFAVFMEELTVALNKDQNAIFELGLDMRAFKSLAILGGKAAEEFSNQIENMTDVVGANEVAFQKMMQTTDNQWKLFKNQMNVEWQAAGKVILPILGAAIRGVSDKIFMTSMRTAALADHMKKLNEETKKTSGTMFMFPTPRFSPELLKLLFGEPDEVTTIARDKSLAFQEFSLGMQLDLHKQIADSVFSGANAIEKQADISHELANTYEAMDDSTISITSHLADASSMTLMWGLAAENLEGTLYNIAALIQDFKSKKFLSGLGRFAGTIISAINPALGGAILGGSAIAGELGLKKGADFTVPEGFPNDSFPMRVSSGEQVSVTPKDQAGGGVNINLALTVNGGMSAGEARSIANEGLANMADQFRKAIDGRHIRKSDLQRAI